MIRGYVFANQLASHDVDSMIFRKMLDDNDGIFKGIGLSYTNTTITVSEGIIMVAGRPVGIIGTESVTAGTDTAYCKLVMEIDLSKESTESTFEQASLKIIKSTTGYPNLTQEDMDNGGLVYQVELARFRTIASGITDFTDTRKFLDFKSIYSKVNADCQAILDQIEQELHDIESGSAYVLRSEFKKITISKNPPTGTDWDIHLQYFD